MKATLLIIALVALVGCASTPPSWGELHPNDLTKAQIEEAVRTELKTPTGELTEADLEKVTALSFYNWRLTKVTGLEKFTNLRKLNLVGNYLIDLKGLEKLTQLTYLDLTNAHLTNVTGLEKLTNLTYLDLDHNHDLTKAQIAELQKALPKCKILGNFKK